MSKSKGNTISPDDYIKEYGADVFRLYLMFGFQYEEGGAWSDDGIKSISKFVERMERILGTALDAIKSGENNKETMDKLEKELNFVRNHTIKSVETDTEKFQFNTSIARMMEFTNALSKYVNEKDKNLSFLKDTCIDYIKLLAPFAPHLAEDLWEAFGNTTSVFNAKYPVCDESALVKDEVEIAIQVNGKIKAKINIASGLEEEEIKAAALDNDSVKAAIGDKTVVKVIVIKGRLVNIVVK